ncbi:MAG TPA: hypothetical protein VGN34_12320 [Ktedonobacteraceae bacterium]|jgi:hypothetical protein
MSMPRSVLRHRPSGTEIQEWIIASPRQPARPQHTALSLARIQQSHPLVLMVHPSWPCW